MEDIDWIFKPSKTVVEVDFVEAAGGFWLCSRCAPFWSNGTIGIDWSNCGGWIGDEQGDTVVSLILIIYALGAWVRITAGPDADFRGSGPLNSMRMAEGGGILRGGGGLRVNNR